MSRKGDPNVEMPRSGRVGEVIRIRTKIRHPMETGWRKGPDEKPVPRDRITRFTCAFNGRTVFSADFHSGVALNPYLAFYTTVQGSGTYDFTWLADGNESFRFSVPFNLAMA